MKKILFLAVVYNNEIDTADFCKSLSVMKSGGVDISCVLIDNSDRDELMSAVDLLGEKYDFVEVLRPPNNTGYFGAFNYFFENSYIVKYSSVVLCNNDLVFKENFLENYISAKYEDDVFVVCPDVITMDGVHQNPHVFAPLGNFARLKLDLYFSHYYVSRLLRRVESIVRLVVDKPQRHKPSKSGYLHMGIGACYILRLKFLEEFGTLQYPHFLYGEEAYLSRQVHSMGGRLYYDETLKVDHKESATLAKLPSRVTYEFGRDGYWIYRKFY